MKEWVVFTDRLYFVEIDARIFAVMAYSHGDARRQVEEAQFSEYWTGHWQRMLESGMREYDLWCVATMRDWAA